MFKWLKKDGEKSAPKKQDTKKTAVQKKQDSAPAKKDEKGFKLPEVNLGGLFGKAKDTGLKTAEKAGALAKTASDATKNKTSKLTQGGKELGQNAAKKTEGLVKGIKKGSKSVGDAVGGAAKGAVETQKKNTTGNLLADMFMPIPVPKKDMKEIQKKSGGNTPPKP